MENYPIYWFVLFNTLVGDFPVDFRFTYFLLLFGGLELEMDSGFWELVLTTFGLAGMVASSMAFGNWALSQVLRMFFVDMSFDFFAG